MPSEPSSPDGVEVSLMLRPFYLPERSPTESYAGSAPELVSAIYTRKNLFPLPEIEPRFLGRQVPSFLTMPIEPSRLQPCCIGLFLILGPKIHGKSNLWKIITALFDIYVGYPKTGDSGILM